MEMESEKGGRFRKNGEGNPRGPRFGREKPAIPGPGRPRLPESVKERRAFLRKQLEEVSVKAIEVVSQILNDPNTEDRDLLRASEISLTHALPRQEEVTLDDERPLREIDPQQLEAKLAELNAAGNGHTSNGSDQT